MDRSTLEGYRLSSERLQQRFLDTLATYGPSNAKTRLALILWGRAHDRHVAALTETFSGKAA